MSSTEPMTNAELIAELGPDRYIEVYADACDTIFPTLGDGIREVWRIIRTEVLTAPHRAIAEQCGADHELAYYRPVSPCPS